jgi:hypothetical protein
MTTRLSTCVDGRPRLGERGGQIGRGGMHGRDTQRLSTCVDGRPQLGERGGHFQAPA